jgi:MFS family permease
VALFVLTSAACGLAPSADLLVVARFLQGVAAALISPTVLSLIGVLFTGPERVRAISIYGIVLGLAAAGGQLVGGVLIEANPGGLGWRSVFLINVPVGLAALAFTWRCVPESRGEAGGRRLDLVGTVILTAGLTAVVLPLIQGRQMGWPRWTWMSLGVAPCCWPGSSCTSAGWAGKAGAPSWTCPSSGTGPSAPGS